MNTPAEKLPPVSVIMSVHDGEKFLREAVDSILAQTYQDFEFIVIDDGSAGPAAAILDQCAAKDSRIRLIRRENRGLTRSLNEGVSLARGRLIARMDADDVAAPERLEQQVAAFEQDSSLVLLGSEVELISEAGDRLGVRGHTPEHEAIRRRLLAGDGGALTHPAVMFRKAAFLQAGGYDESFVAGQDLDLFLRLTELGTARNLNGVLLAWRQHAGSVNRSRSSTWAGLKQQALRKTIDRIGTDRYLAEVLSGGQNFSFPSEPLDLGRMAMRNGRRATARRLFWAAARSGPRRREALEELCETLLLSSWWKVRAVWRKLAGHGGN